jgi:hypothetical protein
MTSSFHKIKEFGEKNYLRGVCNLMADNEFILSREREFGNAKYIIIAKVEKGEKELDSTAKKI